ncbi:MAG: zinc-binding dehydrogenase [Bacteroidota bacterium]
MKGITITQSAEPLQLVTLEKPELKPETCLVKLRAAALNRRDQWIREGKYPNIQFNTVLGSDGCGIVEEGPEEWLGKEVVLNPNVDWGNNPDVQSRNYSVLGMPTPGTLGEYIVVPTDRIHLKPTHLSTEEAAALPLGGLTAFRATMKKGLASEGKNVLITGAGGGVSQFALAFSVASGAETYVTSSSQEKIAKCLKLGAEHGFNYSDENWSKEAARIGFDVIIDGAGGNEVNNYLKIIHPGGRIVMYGSTTGYPEKLDVFRLFWSQAQIMGATMGNDAEFEEMLAFVSQHQIRPTIDRVFPLTEYLKAFDRFKEPDHFGKIVLKL